MKKAAVMAISDQERDVLRHALGLDRCRVSYRNSYSATPMSDTYPVCMGLVAKGLMVRGAFHETMIHFHVTESGKALVLG